MEHILRPIIAEHQESWIDFTKALIEIPTENPPGVAYRTCVDLLAHKLAEIGLEYTLLEVPALSSSQDSGYCLLSSYGVGEKTLYFHGHYDVVPANDSSQFRPFLKDGQLFGRGSSDMKGGLVAMIAAIQAIKESGIRLQGNIGLTIVADEETGGQRGTQYLVDQGLLGRNGIGMLTAEPTDGQVWNANRGAISLRVRIKGKPAHVGLHYQGVNAFEQMLIVANTLAEYRRTIAQRLTQFRIEPEAARASILLMGGQCSGGSNFNVVPAECSFTVDRRINPEEDLAEEKQRLLAAFDRLKEQGIDLDIDVFQEAPSSGVSELHPLAQTLAHTITAVTGNSPVFEMCPGLLETRWYAQRGIPAFAYGPGLLTVSHGPHEYIPIKNIAESALIYAMTAVQFLAED